MTPRPGFPLPRICHKTRLHRSGRGFVAILLLLLLSPPTGGAPLTTAAEVRRLALEDAAAEHPVRLRGVVTLVDPGRTVFFQDSTGGAFIKVPKHVPQDIASGHEIEVSGVTFPGLYLPGIEPKNVQIVGDGTMPMPQAVTIEELASGQHNYEWVQVRGIVRSVTTDSDRTILLLAMGSDRLEVHALGAHPAEHLVDAAVVVTGLAAGFINDKRQLVAPHLRIRDLSDVLVEEPAAANPFDQASVPASHLLRFSPEQRPGHRVKVTGVVTLHEPGRAIFLRDDEQGLYVETAQEAAVQPGDVVEVLGFPGMGRFSAYLQNASFRVISSGPPPEPVHSQTRELLRGPRDADLVSVEAQFVKLLPGSGSLTMLMQSGETLFRARSTFPGAEKAPPRVGSLLRLTGVCQVAEAEQASTGFRSNPSSFELILRSPGGVALIRAAPWWTAQRLAIAAGLLLAATTAALGWAALLRHQVRRQTALLRDKMEAEIVLEERQRLAREFHDTLEQELVGLSLRLDALATRVADPKPRALLDSTRKLLQRLQAEARALVWDLRERAALRGDVAAAIRQATRSVSDAVQIDVRMEGTASSLPETTQHHLVRIAQEAVTNAVKHGKATVIRIDLVVTPEDARLKVSDNGSGFDTASDGLSRPGHFGLIGMKERARKVEGEMKVTSLPGSGTTVEITLPSHSAARPALPSGPSPA